MKRSTLFLIFLLPLLTNAQQFTDNGNTWVQKGEDLVATRFPFYLTTDGDTTINGMAYRKVYAQDAVYLPTSSYVGAVREENDQVYVVPAEMSPAEEFLIYDWQAQAGDTLSTKEFSWVIVDEVTNINLLNGTSRKQFNCSRYQVQSTPDPVRLPLTIIEGIGCTDYAFLLDPFFEVPGGSFGDLFASPEELRCFSSNEVLLWQNENISTCDTIISSQQELIPISNYSVAPNPVRRQIQLYGPASQSNSVFSVHLYNTQGQLCQSWTEMVGTWPRAFDVSTLPAGLYTLFIKESEKANSSTVLRVVKL